MSFEMQLGGHRVVAYFATTRNKGKGKSAGAAPCKDFLQVQNKGWQQLFPKRKEFRGEWNLMPLGGGDLA